MRGRACSRMPAAGTPCLAARYAARRRLSRYSCARAGASDARAQTRCDAATRLERVAQQLFHPAPCGGAMGAESGADGGDALALAGGARLPVRRQTAPGLPGPFGWGPCARLGRRRARRRRRRGKAGARAKSSCACHVALPSALRRVRAPLCAAASDAWASGARRGGPQRARVRLGAPEYLTACVRSSPRAFSLPSAQTALRGAWACRPAARRAADAPRRLVQPGARAGALRGGGLPPPPLRRPHHLRAHRLAGQGRIRGCLRSAGARIRLAVRAQSDKQGDARSRVSP